MADFSEAGFHCQVLETALFQLVADFEAVLEADHLEVAAHHCEFDFGHQFLRHFLEAAFETAAFLEADFQLELGLVAITAEMAAEEADKAETF